MEGWGWIRGWEIISGSLPLWFSVLGKAETLGVYGRMLWHVVGVNTPPDLTRIHLLAYPCLLPLEPHLSNTSLLVP